MKLNVCLMNDSFPPLIDGVSNTVINYARIIHSTLGNATVVTPKYPKTVDSYEFPVMRYPSFPTTRFVGYRTGYPFSLKTLRRLEAMKFDILHSHCPMASNLLARTLRERVDAPLILTYHTKFDIEIGKVFTSEHMRSLASRIVVNNIKVCDEVWVVSRGAGENLRTLGYEGDYIVMPNGVDLPRTDPDPVTRAEMRRQFGISDDTPVFLFVGRCMWYKGFRFALDAMKKLKSAGRSFKYIVVGDSKEKDEIRAYAEECGLGDDSIFVGSVYDRQEICRYFGMADLFLFPSTFDTNGLVVREAAAMALPSLIIKDSCAAEGITHMKNGILAEEDADSIAAEIAATLDRPGKLREIGRNAQAEIYIPWEDAVTQAYQRYEYLYEKMRRGEIPRKDVSGNGIFELVADWSAVMSKMSRRSGKTER